MTRFLEDPRSSKNETGAKAILPEPRSLKKQAPISRYFVALPTIGMRVYPGTSLQRHAIAQGAITTETGLREPLHHIAPRLSAEQITNRRAQFVKTDLNWIVGEPLPSFQHPVERRRNRRSAGSLWTCFAVLQRLPTVSVATAGNAE